MTDHELALYLGIIDEPNWREAIARLPAQRRATYEHMARVEHQLQLWQAGLGPRPTGVLIDEDRRRTRH
jgi:hypothetical protein